jgi:hypothetical protein
LNISVQDNRNDGNKPAGYIIFNFALLPGGASRRIPAPATWFSLFTIHEMNIAIHPVSFKQFSFAD